MNGILNKYQTILRDKLIHLFHRYSLPRWIVFTFDNMTVLLMFYLAYLLRFNFIINDLIIRHAVVHGFIVLVIYMIFSILFRSYTGIIRHTTLTDLTLVFAVTTFSASILLLLSLLSRIFNWNPVFTVPFSVILIHFGLITVFLFFVRISLKILFRFATGTLRKTNNVLIYGAGDLGFIVKRIILSDPGNDYNVRGFIDDDKRLQGKKINDIPVYSPEKLNPEFLSENKIRNIILAIRNISPGRKGEILRKTVDLGLETLEMPSVRKWLNANPEIKHLQKVKLEDLLGREPNEPDEDLLNRELYGRTILVTGAAGSIGSEIVRQLIRFRPGNIILVDQAETPMFQIENELKKKNDGIRMTFIIGDITNPEKIDRIIREYEPDLIYHSAAYKHVPLMEDNPHEAFEVNVAGTKIVAESAVRYNVGKVILISTDKCNDPSCVMSISRFLSEMIIRQLTHGQKVTTKFIIIRFGNVLGSGGSVVPLFRQQISEGGPVTVTHPEMSRYFMTIPEACELILESGCLGQGGETYLFDMGEPVKIADMAEKMIKLSGFEPGKDIEIVFTGLRPGEKLNEGQQAENLVTIPTTNAKIRLLQTEEIKYPDLLTKIDAVYKNLYNYSKQEITDIMNEMVWCNK